MSRLFVSILCVMLWAQGITQSNLSIGIGQTNSTFLFKTSNGYNSSDYQSIINYSHCLQYRTGIAKSLYFSPELTYKKLGASASFNGAWHSWQLDYVDLAIGTGIYLKLGNWRPYLGILAFSSYLLRGQQISGASSYNIKNEKSIKSFDLGISPMIGVDLVMIQEFRIFAETRYSFGINQLENAAVSNQKLFNRYLSVYIGVRIPF